MSTFEQSRQALILCLQNDSDDKVRHWCQTYISARELLQCAGQTLLYSKNEGSILSLARLDVQLLNVGLNRSLFGQAAEFAHYFETNYPESKLDIDVTVLLQLAKGLIKLGQALQRFEHYAANSSPT